MSSKPSSLSSLPPLTDSNQVDKIAARPDESKIAMADPTDAQQGAAAAAATPVKSATPPQVLHSSPSSADLINTNTAAPSVPTSFQSQVASLGGSFTPPSPRTVAWHPQQHHQQLYVHHQYPQQHHSHFVAAPPLPSPHYHHAPQFQNPYQHYYPSHGGDHPHYSRPNEVQYASHGGSGHYHHPASCSPVEAHMRAPPNCATFWPATPSPGYQSPYYPQPMPPATTTRDDRFAFQMAATPITGTRRGSMYHPYHIPVQQAQTPPQPSPVPSSPALDLVEQLKDSTIYAPGTTMVTDGSALNYGRLPDGKIIELFPAMMRTMQACEFCRSRKAKCSGGLPCERCSKKSVKCEYAQLDPKRRVKVTTSEHDMSGRSRKSSNGKKSSKFASIAPVKGGSNSSKAKISSSRSESTRKSARNRSLKPEAASSLYASKAEDVPLDLASSPFTPISLLYQQDVEQEHFIPVMPVSFSHQSNISAHHLIAQEHQSSPASTASQSSIEQYNSGPAPEAIFSPIPFHSAFYEDAGDAWAHDEVAAPSVPQESSFRHNHYFHHTSFC